MIRDGTYLKAWPEGKKGVHEVACSGVWSMHVHVQQHWALTHILHNGAVMLQRGQLYNNEHKILLLGSLAHILHHNIKMLQRDQLYNNKPKKLA